MKLERLWMLERNWNLIKRKGRDQCEFPRNCASKKCTSTLLIGNTIVGDGKTPGEKKKKKEKKGNTVGKEKIGIKQRILLTQPVLQGWSHQPPQPMTYNIRWKEFRMRNRIRYSVLWEKTCPFRYLDVYLRKNFMNPDSCIFPYLEKH